MVLTAAVVLVGMRAVRSISMLLLSRQDYQRIRPSLQKGGGGGSMRSSAAQLSATTGREDGERPVRQWWKDLLIYSETLGVRVVVFYNYKLRGKKTKKLRIVVKVRDTEGKVPGGISPGVGRMGRGDCMQINQ